ncbi:MAG TPA: tetratricopeptide repeat protein [Chitinophagaceae bacterium]|nr:tetratricopeptide repeat protein [Chitinophagaceae bacterium]
MKRETSHKPTAVADPEAPVNQRHLARQYELAGENKKAITIYEQLIKKYPSEALLWDRLMILYRKEKLLKKELAIVEKAIDNFKTLLLPHTGESNKKVASLSKSILHAVGLADKKGTALYYPEPIAKWQRRRTVVKKKLAALEAR